MSFSVGSPRMMTTAFWLGRVAFADALKVQQRFANKLLKSREEHKIQSPNRHYLMLLEHQPVYTVGIRHSDYSKDEEERLKSLGADFVRTDRGGLITFHGPGQLVAYPILDLNAFSLKGGVGYKGRRVGVRRYVNLMEEMIIRTMHNFGLSNADRTVNTGVWLGYGQRKIAAVGVNVKDGITSHGLALNCNVDLSWFQKIVPCGLVGKDVTSMSAELDRDVTVKEVIPVLLSQFGQIFNSDVIQSEDECDTILDSDHSTEN